MKKKERHSKIIDFITANAFASISDLSINIDCSESTIKRDLIELQRDGIIRRVHGGAMLVNTDTIDVPYLTKLDSHVNDSEKKELAKRALKYIHNDMTLFFDSSTTILHMIPFLKSFLGLKIVTNGILTATLLSEYTEHEIFVVGGKVRHRRFTVNSGPAIDQIKIYHFDISFVSCRGFSEKYGLTENTEGEAVLKNILPSISSEIVALVTSEKIEKVCFYQSICIKKLSNIVFT